MVAGLFFCRGGANAGALGLRLGPGRCIAVCRLGLPELRSNGGAPCASIRSILGAEKPELGGADNRGPNCSRSVRVLTLDRTRHKIPSLNGPKTPGSAG
jgi:hypothetical protein